MFCRLHMSYPKQNASSVLSGIISLKNGAFNFPIYFLKDKQLFSALGRFVKQMQPSIQRN